MLALPAGASAALDAECFAAARRDDRGNFSAALFTLDGDVRAVELPQRGHDITLKPDGREWVAFARRPGRFGVAIPLDARPPVWFAAKPDRHFFGHGVFSADGRLLYTTENDYERAAGMIGVRDATDGYKQIGEFPAHGMEPHDIALLADGRTMVIANGGIHTHPDRGDDELNLPDMQPSLVYVDVATGDLLEEHRLAPALHQLSIRHLAIAAATSSCSAANIAGRKRMRRRWSASIAAARRRSSSRLRPRRRSACAIMSARSRPTVPGRSWRPRPPRAASSPIGTSPGGAISAPQTSMMAAGSRRRIEARIFF